MNPDNSTQLPSPPTHNPLQVMQSGEQVVCEIKRHPIGIVGIYAMVGLMIVTLAVLVYAVAPSVLPNVDSKQIYSLGTLFLLLIAVFGLGFAFINHIIYWGNRWVVTTDSLTQLQQTSLFNKQASQLSLENIEDVTSSENGILAHMFGYGSIRVETAGERSKFTFPFCPQPTACAQKILDARERFMQDIRNKEAGRLEEVPSTQPEPAAPVSPQPPVSPAS